MMLVILCYLSTLSLAGRASHLRNENERLQKTNRALQHALEELTTEMRVEEEAAVGWKASCWRMNNVCAECNWSEGSQCTGNIHGAWGNKVLGECNDYAECVNKHVKRAHSLSNRVCVPCACKNWDGTSYSNCHQITESYQPCGRPWKVGGEVYPHCVQCKMDGTTPMPGPVENHLAECEAWTGGPDMRDCNVPTADFSQSDMDGIQSYGVKGYPIGEEYIFRWKCEESEAKKAECVPGCNACGYNWYERNWNNGNPTSYMLNKDCGCCNYGSDESVFDACAEACVETEQKAECVPGCNACGYNWYEQNWNNGNPTSYMTNKQCGCCNYGGDESVFDACREACTGERRRNLQGGCDANYLKMVLTDSDGKTIKAGYTSSDSKSWQDSSTWSGSGAEYSISNFRPATGCK